MTKQNNKQGDLLGAAPETARQTVEDNLLGRPHVAEKAFSTEATKVLPKGEKTPEQRFAELQDMTRSYLYRRRRGQAGEGIQVRRRRP